MATSQKPKGKPRAFLDFPYLVMENIVKRLPPIDVVSLSLTSIKATNVVASLHPRVAHIFVHLGKTTTSIILKDPPACREERHVLRILNRKDQSGEATVANVLYSPAYRRIDVTEREDATFQSKCLVTNRVVADREQAVNVALKHICALFQLPVYRVTICLDTYPHVGDLLLWQLVNACSDFEIEGNGQVKKSEMKKVFRKVNIGNCFALPDTTAESVCPHFNKLKDMDMLDLYGAKWFTNKHLAQLNVKYAFIRCSEITAAGINEFLRRWLDSNDTRTCAIRIDTHRAVTRADVFRGLERVRIRVHRDGEWHAVQVGSFLRHIRVGSHALVRHTDKAAAVVDIHDEVTINMIYDADLH